MNKFFRLMGYLGFVPAVKVFCYMIVRKLEKKLSNYQVEVYQMLNHINRHGGILEAHREEFQVAFDYANHRPSFFLRKNSSDAHVLSQIFDRLEYLPLVTLINSLGGDSIKRVVDAGANAGFTSVFLGIHFPNATIVAVEPDQGNFAVLSKNLTANKVGHVALQKALWNSAEKLKLSDSFRDNREWSRQIEKVNETTSVGLLDGITFMEVMKMQNWDRLDVLKMDIEGSEKYVFDNEHVAMEILSRIRFLAIELHDETDFRTRFEEYLKKAGFIYTNTGESLIGFNKNLVKAN